MPVNQVYYEQNAFIEFKLTVFFLLGTQSGDGTVAK